jgi:hypothetical protein
MKKISLIIALFSLNAQASYTPGNELTTFIGRLRYAGTAACEWTTGNATSYTNFGADTDCPTASVAGSITAPVTKIPGAVMTNAPAGTYMVVVQGDLNGENVTTGAKFRYRLSDGTNTSGLSVAQVTGGVAIEPVRNTLVGYFTYSSTQASVTWQIQALSSSTSNDPYIINANTDSALEISVYKFSNY